MIRRAIPSLARARCPAYLNRMTMRDISLLCAALAVPILVAGPASADPRQIAVLQGLDKVTARVSTFQAPVDQTVAFGSFRITVRMCDRAPVTEAPESTAFLEVVEQEPGQDLQWVFSGWMFASSPAVSAIEHPVYDVRVLECADEAELAQRTDLNAEPAPKAEDKPQ